MISAWIYPLVVRSFILLLINKRLAAMTRLIKSTITKKKKKLFFIKRSPETTRKPIPTKILIYSTVTLSDI